ncbi:28S ribosomal protein S9, mitochondrial [Tanacetum coccineum]
MNQALLSTTIKGHRYFSTENNDNNNNKSSSSSWNISSSSLGEQSIESLFSFNAIQEQQQDEKEDNEKKQEEEEDNRLLDEEGNSLSDVLGWRTRFNSSNRAVHIPSFHLENMSAHVKSPDHAFGDLIATSGITDDMLASLIALKDLDDVPGLPPLSAIVDMYYEKNTRVDRQGRAYGTGKRKCSIARVWIEPGEGKFLINDYQFDVFFPMLDQRAALLRPLTGTKTLGLLDINCTVKGGGVSDDDDDDDVSKSWGDFLAGNADNNNNHGIFEISESVRDEKEENRLLDEEAKSLSNLLNVHNINSLISSKKLWISLNQITSHGSYFFKDIVETVGDYV